MEGELPPDSFLQSLLDELDNALRRYRHLHTEGAWQEAERLKAQLRELGATVVIPLEEQADAKKPIYQVNICRDVSVLPETPGLVANVSPDHVPEDGEIVAVLSVGCYLGHRVIREAQVIVFKGDEYGEV